MSVTASVGAASMHDSASGAEALIAAADAALYEAKRAGKNQVASAEVPRRRRPLLSTQTCRKACPHAQGRSVVSFPDWRWDPSTTRFASISS